MWLHFNQNGQLLEQLGHGYPARTGSNDFQIFAVFDGITEVFNGTATIKFFKPDLEENSTYQLGMTSKTDELFELMPNEHSNYFQNGQKYNGFLFDARDLETILLDTTGNWGFSITVYEGTLPKTIKVLGRGSFMVELGTYNNQEETDAVEIAFEAVYAAMNGKVNTTSQPKKVYITNEQGLNDLGGWSVSSEPSSFVVRDENGNVKVSETPVYDDDAVSKKYVDDRVSNVDFDIYNLVTLDTEQYIEGEKQFEKPVKFGINAGFAPSIGTTNKSVDLLIQTGQKASSITLEDAREYGPSARGILFKTTTYDTYENGFRYGYAKMPTNDGSSEDNYYVIATTNDVKQLYDLIFDNIIVPVEETLKGVNLFIPSTFTLDDNLQHELIENTGLDITEIKGNTWVKNQLFTGFDKYVYVNPDTATKEITTTNKIQVKLTADSDSITFFTQPDAYNEKPFIVGHKYFISCKLTYPTAKTTRYIVGLNAGQGATYFENQTSGITTCTFNDEPLIAFYGTFNTDDTFSVENLKVIDLTQMFGAGKEPTTIDEFNKLTANVEFYNTNEVDLGTLTWWENASGGFSSSAIADINYVGSINQRSNISTSKYPTLSLTELTNGTFGIALRGSKDIWIKDSTYATPNELKQSLQGVILKYETNETYVEPTIINTSITELKSYGEYASVDLGTLDYTQISNGVFKSISLRYLIKSITGYREKPHIICDKFKVDTPANLEGSNPPNMSISIGGDGYSVLINDNSYTNANDFKQSLQGVILYYQPQDFTQANLLGTYPLSIPTLYGIGTAQDSVNQYGYVKRIGSYTFTGNETFVDYAGAGKSLAIQLQGAKGVANNNIVGNIVWELGGTTYVNNINNSPEFTIAIGDAGLLYISTTKTSSELATALTGKTIYYELATPQTNETDLQLPQDIKFERNGVIATGSLTATDITINVNVKDWGK
jgi:hypothetical protein